MTRRDQLQETLCNRLFWHTAERDDAKAADHLFHRREMDVVYAMDEATLFDSFFNYLWEIDVFPLLEQLDPQKQKRKNVPFIQLLLVFVMKVIGSIKTIPVGPPWPDVVIGVGRSIAPVTAWIGRQSGGTAYSIHLGRGGEAFINGCDAVITPMHCQMPSDDRRYEIMLPLNPVSRRRLSEAKSKWPDLLEGMPEPVVLLLVGGDATHFCLDAGYAGDMAENVLLRAEKSGGSVVAVTSRRTRRSAVRALASVLKSPHRLYEWRPNQKENPYYAFFAHADILVVTGESESMLAEAASTDKPFYIYPVPELSETGLISKFKKYYIRHANAHFSGKNKRSSGIRLIDAACAWFMRLGGIIPGRDMNVLHNALYSSGRAHPFGDSLVTGTYQPLRKAEDMAGWIKKVIIKS